MLRVTQKKMLGGVFLLLVLTGLIAYLVDRARHNQVATVTRSLPIPAATPSADSSSTTPRPSISQPSQHMSLTQLNNQISPQLGQRWVLTVANFSQREQAAILLSRLRNARFDAQLREVNSADGSPRYKIIIGPEWDKSIFTQIKVQLRHQFHLHALNIAPVTQ